MEVTGSCCSGSWQFTQRRLYCHYTGGQNLHRKPWNRGKTTTKSKRNRFEIKVSVIVYWSTCWSAWFCLMYSSWSFSRRLCTMLGCACSSTSHQSYPVTMQYSKRNSRCRRSVFMSNIWPMDGETRIMCNWNQKRWTIRSEGAPVTTRCQAIIPCHDCPLPPEPEMSRRTEGL